MLGSKANGIKLYVLSRFKSKMLMIIIFVFLASGCSSYKFLSFKKKQSKLSTEKIFSVADFSNTAKDDLYQLCLSLGRETLEDMVRLLACTNALLAKDALSHQQQKFAITEYNLSLNEIISPLLNNKQHTPHNFGNLSISFDTDLQGDIYLLSDLLMHDQELQFSVFGELGVAGVFARKNTAQGNDAYYPLEGVYRPINFSLSELRKVGSKWQLKIANEILLQQKSKIMGKNKYSLNYSPASAYLVLVEQADIDQLSWTGMINPGEADARRGIFAIEELNDNKTPILMTHGLNSDPLIWLKLTLALLNDRELHDTFQIWHAYYPSGSPPFYNAMMIRKRLKNILSKHPGLNKKSKGVFIGHSMGGIVNKTMVTSSGYQLWDATYTLKPDELLQQSSDYEMEKIFVFEPVFEKNISFFVDTPHKGSNIASSLVGYLGSALITLPDKFLDLNRSFINRIGADKLTLRMLPYMQNFGPNSVQTMRPGHPLVEVLDELPIHGKVYSVIGSQSILSCQSEQQCLEVNDGVVDYISAHNQQAEEEIVVSSSHDSYKNEKSISFILAKLREATLE
ncbi:MAG: hypothetical protein ACJASG_001890 [Oleiphilaceae bacterium]|jgi:hypothetical protein